MPLLGRVGCLRIVAEMTTAIRVCGVSQPLADPLIGFQFDLKIGQLTTFQGHHHPTAYRGVCTALWRITPSTTRFVLSEDDVVDGFLGRLQ